MEFTKLITGLNVLAALSALVAAVLWHKSATVKISFDDRPRADGFHSAGIIVGEDTDFI